jgi:iron-sulfur cluster assembly protein
MITVTQNAIDQIKKIQADEHKTDAVLRIGVKAGGCSGFEYVMGFDAAAEESDLQVEQQGITIVVDPKCESYLKGITLDFQGGLGGTGFAFSNPNAKGTCGCGTSFQV